MMNSTPTREERFAEFAKACGNEKYKFKFSDSQPGDMYCKLVNEELNEFCEASEEYEAEESPETRAQLCKEWADLQYVVSQLAWYYNIPADAAFNRVHINNMTKVGPDGSVRRREDGKILKPEGYQPPDMSGL